MSQSASTGKTPENLSLTLARYAAGTSADVIPPHVLERARQIA